MKKFLSIRSAGLIILIVLVLYIAYAVYGMVHDVATGLGKMVIVDDMPKEYASLFKTDSNITYRQTHFDDNKHRNPVSDFIYEAKYGVFVTRIKTSNSLNSLPLITPQFHKTKTTDDTLYSIISLGYSEFHYSVNPLTASNISLTLNGDSVRSLIKSNVIEGYYLRNKAFSISYKNDGVVNLFMKTTKTEDPAPSVLLFLVHEKSLYFVCISVLDPNDKFNMDVINKLMGISVSPVSPVSPDLQSRTK